ncbi:MAG: hypothetical protein E7647_06555 [Ruminococcaceae bacterium]|nr:hypothetical protein [Oscillospiraceae bacterium]
MKEAKTKQKQTKDRKKLGRAVNTLASIIDSIATSMKGDIDRGEECDLRQLKDLTGAAKELCALISSLDPEERDEKTASLTVLFEGEGEKWAK